MGKFILSGGIAGFLNGFLGGGGGAVLVPLLQQYCKRDQRSALACSVAIIVPLSMLSAFLFAKQGHIDMKTAFPYVLGGAVGGILGGKLFPKANSLILQRGFAILLILSGGRCLL